jgi:hypothetical protein
MPRLLFRVEYQEQNFHIGRLDEGIQLELDQAKAREEKAIRSVDDYQLNIDRLLEKLGAYKNVISHMELIVDPDLRFTSGDFVESVQNRLGSDKVSILNPINITEG